MKHTHRTHMKEHHYKDIIIHTYTLDIRFTFDSLSCSFFCMLRPTVKCSSQHTLI